MKKISKLVALLLIFLGLNSAVSAQEASNDVFIVKGFCVNAPAPSELNRFIKFIGDELAPRV